MHAGDRIDFWRIEPYRGLQPAAAMKIPDAYGCS
jgi:hypothetical protein